MEDKKESSQVGETTSEESTKNDLASKKIDSKLGNTEVIIEANQIIMRSNQR